MYEAKYWIIDRQEGDASKRVEVEACVHFWIEIEETCN